MTIDAMFRDPIHYFFIFLSQKNGDIFLVVFQSKVLWHELGI